MKEISKEGENDVLLVCTVGGAPRPVALSIIQHKPKRVLFIASKESKSQISRQGFKKRNESTREIDGRGILQICRDEKFDLDPGRYTIAEVEHQELQSCIETVREYVRQEIDQWAGNQPTVIFDFTGGTKLMTAALAMIGRQLPIEFSYVASKEKSDGNDARDKNGLGVTLDGEENVLRLRNPWDALGYQSIETAVMLFNQGNFAAAKQIVEDHRNKVNDRCSKQQLVTWAQLFSGYLCWDQFDHKKAQQHILDVLKNFANIQRWLLRSNWQTIEVKLKKDEDFLQQLNKGSNRNTLLDLLSNAGRRAHEGRYDDAVARMYRAIEAAAQFRLKEHGIDSSSVNKGQVPENLQKKWCSRFKSDETIKLALQDDYELLNALGNPLGNRFFEKELNKEQSPLGIRNSSILAHGFTPVSEKAYTKLRDITLDLLEIEKGELMVFPELRI
jgi:CRISPR-associated protein (TIGR02710 family)